MAYTTRKRRARMAERDSRLDESDTLGEGIPVADGEAPSAAAPVAEDDAPRAFVSADFFKGRKMKVGDTETVRVESIDPETGEHEIVCVYGEGDEDRKSMGDMMDEAIPEV